MGKIKVIYILQDDILNLSAKPWSSRGAEFYKDTIAHSSRITEMIYSYIFLIYNARLVYVTSQSCYWLSYRLVAKGQGVITQETFILITQ